jgi:uncharacterized protein (TIGR03437 family)
LNRSRYLVGTALFALLLCAGLAPAQTATNLKIISGNGQLVCQTCFGPTGSMQPLVVRVTDANGAPVNGASVSWAITSSGLVTGQLSADTSTSDANGYAYIFYFPGFLYNGGTASFAYSQVSITATSGSSSVTFYETQGLQADPSQAQGNYVPPVSVRVLQDSRDIVSGSLVTGQVGTTATPPFKIQVVTTQLSQPVPNVGVMLYNELPDTGSPATGTIACAEQAGAGSGMVLTDSNGIATCSPILGGNPNVDGRAYLVIGGSFPLEHFTSDSTIPPAYFVVLPGGGGRLVVRATPGNPGQLRLVSGNQQSAQAGQSLAAPLVAEVISTAGIGLAGQSVNWTVSPAGAAQLGSAQTTTDANGRTSNTLRFVSTAAGAVTVTATLAGDATKTVSVTATAAPNITVSGLTIVSGNNQSALANQAFSSPLVVQVNATGGAASGIPVLFSITGAGTLSATSATTNSNGQASVNVTAGGTAGAVTVTASAAGFTQTFNLTVSPPGPVLTVNSFQNGADFQTGALSPCSIATVTATGLAPGLQGMVVGATFGPLPYVVANTKVTVGGSAAPIYSLGRNASGQEQLTFQVPCDVTPGSSVPVVINIGAGNGTISIPIRAASPGIFQTVMSDGQSRAVVVRPDGSFVSLQNPARRGENLVAFLTGLGATNPPLLTNSVAPPSQVTAPAGTVVVGMAGGGVPLISTQLSPDLVGVWLVTFTVPGGTPASNNAVFSVSVIPQGSNTPISSGTTSIPIQ